MWRAMPTLFIGLAIVSLTSMTAGAQSQDQIVAISQCCGAYGQAAAVTASGDVFVSTHGPQEPFPPNPWTFVLNIYESCGAPGSDVVGLVLGAANYVLLSDGSLVSGFLGGGCSSGGNIFADAGRSPGGQRFVCFGQTAEGIAHGYPPFLYAATDGGDIYRNCLESGQGGWRFIGNVRDNLPVPTELKTWGRIKAERR